MNEGDIKIIEEIVNFKAIEIISVGALKKSYLNYDVHIIDSKLLNESFTIVEKVLLDKGIIIKNK